MTRDELVVADVTKRYADGDRTVEAVSGVSLTVGSGELVLLVGPSGSGKTTLLGILGGLVTPTSGDVRVQGSSLVSMRDHHRTAYRRSHVGFVFQELALVPEMTLLENVLLPLVPRGVTHADRERAQALLERFGLGARSGTRAGRLSGGERQRGAIARALVHEPRILLLDEPTAHVDAENAAGLLELLVRLASEGKTIVATTHDPRLASDPRVTRVVKMRDGRLEP